MPLAEAKVEGPETSETLMTAPDMSRLSRVDIEDIERSKGCQRTCPGPDACLFRCSISVLHIDRYGRAGVGVGPCAVSAAWKVRERIERIIPSSRMPPRLKECTFSSFLTGRACKSVVFAKRLAFSAGQAGETIVLAGDTGVGKTHLAAAIVNYVPTKGRSAILVSFVALLNDLRSSLSAGKDVSSSSQIFEVLKSADCLALDDVGQEVRSDYADSCLFQIVDDRYNARSQLVITTNYPTYEAFAEAGPRRPYVVRRLREMGHWIRIEAEAYRGRGG
jgi:DNA replication protein DnaC